MATLAVNNGRNVIRDSYRLGELSNAGKPWRNSTGSFRGEPFTGTVPPRQAWASDAEHAELVRHVKAGELDYVIYSYATVVAYRAHGVWHVTSTRHSSTTSKHVGRLYVLTMARTGYEGPDAT
jgi:hypothetical protein